MCDPVTIGVVVGIVGVTAGTTTAVIEQKNAEEQKKAADKTLSFEAGKSGLITRQAAEEAAEENYRLAREAAVNRGLAYNSGLGVTSVRALSSAVGFELGQDKATVQKNMDTANADAMARMDAANMNRESAYGVAGDTTGLRLGLNIGGSIVTSVIGGAAAGAASSAAEAAKAAGTLAQVGTAAAAAGNTALASASTAAATAATATSAGLSGTAGALGAIGAGLSALQIGANAMTDDPGKTKVEAQQNSVYG